MDAVKFLEEVKKICKSQSTCVEDNKACPIVCHRNGYCIGSALKTIEEDDFPNIVNIVEQWSRKTRSSEFLKHYPNVGVFNNGAVNICPKLLDKSYNPSAGCNDTNCYDCKTEYWMQEVE